MNTAARAKISLGTGDNASARRWLDQAEKECSTSWAVMREISLIYALMGDSVKASLYDSQSRKLAPLSGSSQTALAANIAVTAEPDSFVRDKFALVVGVGKFQSAEVRPLAYTAKDASDFAALLRDPEVGRFRDDGDHVQLLTDEQATLVNVRTAINRIAKLARAEDLVLLYFSSHGSSPEMDAASEKGRTGYIVTYDTDPANLYATAFPMAELEHVVLDRLKPGRVVTFLDTCYSGDTIRRNPGGDRLFALTSSDPSVARIAQGKGRAIITSSRGSERSWESDKLRNGFFTWHLLEAMRARKGLLTVTQLYSYLQSSVPRAVLAEKKAQQNPLMLPEGRDINIVIGTAVE